jgi:hypothetical protein
LKRERRDKRQNRLEGRALKANLPNLRLGIAKHAVGNASRNPNSGELHTLRRSYTNSIAQLLGIGSQMRSQNPTLRQTAGQDPRWYIRPYVDHLQADHSIKRVKERIYLGSCAEMTKRQAQAEAAKAMGMLNDRRRVVLAQINFGPFLD